MPENCRVIVIDDDTAAMQSVSALLKAYRFHVLTFESAEEFLEAKVDLHRSCLLCDVRLSGMSGLALHHRLRSDGIQIPTILISGYADSTIVAEALRDGAIAVLEKPVDPHELIAQIGAVFQSSDPA